VAKSEPDGYTLLLVPGTHVLTPRLLPNLGYHAINDFSPVATLVFAPYVIIGAKNLPFTTLKDAMQFAREQPGKISIGNSEVTTRLAGESLAKVAGVTVTHVPYKGGAQAITDLIGGQVTFLFVDLASSRPHVQSGRVRALALSAEQKSALAADLPTVAEQANLPGFDLAAWIGVVGPAGMPPAIVNKLSDRLAAMLVRKDVAERLVGLGVEAHPSTAAELDAYMKRQLEGWGRKVKDAGIQPE
jgi:tripartite-type tricarboxylate transporter receptor subunit TctC